jgi:hypothetical protein
LKPFLCGDTQEKHTAIDFLITALKIKKINWTSLTVRCERLVTSRSPPFMSKTVAGGIVFCRDILNSLLMYFGKELLE